MYRPAPESPGRGRGSTGLAGVRAGGAARGLLAGLALAAAGCLAAGAGGAPPPARGEPASQAPPRAPIPRFVAGKLPAGAEVLLRHGTRRARRLTYTGTVREEVLVSAGGRPVPVSSKTYRVRRTGLVRPAGAGLARAYFYSEDRLVDARQAGRDRLAELRARPSGGVRVRAIVRRLSPRGAEPATGDRSLERVLSPLPEVPRMPAAKVSAGRPVSRRVGDYLVTWKLTGAGRFGERGCWVLVREVSVSPEAKGAALPVKGRTEYLVDSADGTLLRVVSHWGTLTGTKAFEHRVALVLAGAAPLSAGAVTREAAGVEVVRELLRAVAARNVEKAGRLAARPRLHRPRGPAFRLAARFAAAEKQLAAAAPGARRVELVPEDSFVYLSAPEKLKPGARLVPVVFLHGAGAGPKAYFQDWRRHAGKRPLLLIFPQSRGWTWSAGTDGALVGSLLEILGRTYRLDRSRLVLAGHAAGGELAFALGYGADFRGYRLRGIVACGAAVPKRIRLTASDRRPPELVARLRAVDVLLLGGELDKKCSPSALKNLARWLRSFKPDGVRLRVTPRLGYRYSADWTPGIIEWIEALGAGGRPPAGGGRQSDR